MNLEKKNKIIINFVRESEEVKEGRRILQKISDLLTDICEESKKEPNLFYKPLKCFYSKNIPLISIKDYLEHIYKYTKINTSTIILILIYIDRICNIHKCKLCYYNIHKLILGSMIIAIKYNEDEYYSQKFYAKIGGVTLAEICNLEYNFLSLINYNLFVNDNLFSKYNDFILSTDSDDDDSENFNYEDASEEDNKWQ
jgi:hypothetical protein